ncbi:MAG: PIN domain-containing protein [Planctomycetota bacterium]
MSNNERDTPSKPERPCLVFDTSALRRLTTRDPGPDYRRLLNLAREERVRLAIPEMAARELFDFYGDHGRKVIDQLRTTLDKVTSARFWEMIPRPLRERIETSELADSKTYDTLTNSVAANARRRFTSLGLDHIVLDQQDWRFVLDRYFQGLPPFDAPKQREHLPDAMVLAGLLKAKENGWDPIFVCHDGPLGKAAASSGFEVVRDVPEALKLKKVRQLHDDPEFAEWWERSFRRTVNVLREEDLDLSAWLSSVTDTAIQGKTVRSHKIPEDNHEAWVSTTGEPNDWEVDWESAESLGEGVLVCPVTFSVELGLEFGVYRADAWDTPDWVSVSFGDPEFDHYFDASGERVGHFEASMILALERSFMDDTEDLESLTLDLRDIEFCDLA